MQSISLEIKLRDKSQFNFTAFQMFEDKNTVADV